MCERGADFAGPFFQKGIPNMKSVLCVVFLLFFASPVLAFTPQGCGAGKCSDCHHLSIPEATKILHGGVDKVLSVDFSQVPGLWVLEVEKNNQKFPLYLDFTKHYVVAGNIIRLKDHQNITSMRQARLSKVDVHSIPLGDALLLGKADARIKVIVFTDPECPFCRKLHGQLKQVVKNHPEIAFELKMFPLKIHPQAYQVAKAIVCAKSLDMLEASYAGAPVPPASCNTPVVDQNLALAARLGIRSTPTLVLPNGMVFPGYKSAEDIVDLLKSEGILTGPAETAAAAAKKPAAPANVKVK